MRRTLGAALVVGCVAWVVVSAVTTLWSRPAEAAAFGSFCLVAGLTAVLAWRYVDPAA